MSDFLKQIADYSPKRLLLLAAELEQRVRLLERQNHAPIALVGIGCRFPGGVQDKESFWDLLREGRDAISEVPASRWNVDDVYDPDPYAEGKMNSRWGGFIDFPELFDASFFGIAPIEAASMDPQQRLLLEVSWQALEDAGIDPSALDGSRTGVWVGLCNSDYAQRVLAQSGRGIDAYFAQGASHAVAAGRISYFLGLQGPSVAVDTACSSSLVAVHQACQSLRMREVDMALAGGVNLILSPEVTIALSRAQMMSPTGRCQAFSAEADGFVRSEGCGLVALKRLDDALEAGDRIIAVIRGTAVNQDGRSGGLTAPNGPSQEEVIRAALSDANITPDQVGYVEAHGTGTNLGDPIELNALHAALARERDEANKLVVGSVKSNIGHTESAAGVAGLIKVALALSHHEIPPSLHFNNPNEAIDWRNNRLRVPVLTEPWSEPSIGRARTGAVSSFGFSGTNAHTIISEAPPLPVAETKIAPSAVDVPANKLRVVTLSAKSRPALVASASRLAVYLGKRPGLPLEDVAHTLALGRSAFSHRAAMRCDSIAELRDHLQLLAQSDSDNAGRFFQGVVEQKPRVAFLFSGHGGEQAGIGLSLLEGSQVFRAAIEQIDAILVDQIPVSIETIFRNQQGELRRSSLAQPALFAFQYGLSQVWKSWGIEPHIVAGHSIGEFMAATAAGILSVESAARLVAARGRLTEDLSAPGAMAAVIASEKKVSSLLQPYIEFVSIAAINGPQSIVISGYSHYLESAVLDCERAGLRVKRLTTPHGFHSAAMDAVQANFLKELVPVKFHIPQIPIVQGMTGELTTDSNAVDSRYFFSQIRQPVQFLRCLETLRDNACDLLIEVGPRGILTAFGKESGDQKPRWVASANGRERDFDVLQSALAEVFTAGAKVNWKQVFKDRRYNKVSLPTYPFEGERYWVEEEAKTLFKIPQPAGEVNVQRKSYGLAKLNGRPTEFDQPGFKPMPGEPRLAAIERTIQREAAYVLGLSKGKLPPIHARLADLGLDSLMAINLRNRLQAILGRGLSSTFAFDHASVGQMGMAIDMLLWGAGVEEAPSASVEQDEIRI